MIKKLFSFLLLGAVLLASCDEVEEMGKYDNWQERNEAYMDSIARLAGNNYVLNMEQADAMQLGQFYAIKDPSASTSETTRYIYCRKLTANPDGVRPLYTGENSTVSAYYHGTLITGDNFDGNFDGYGATDTSIPLPPALWPTAFDQPTSFTVTGVFSGWTWPLQYMRTGERWLLYIPWQSGYGESGYSSILGYSTLVFDICLESIVK
ncbi:MAG: FKBP-type peptidyl-prolyl cis-trans isomerase [Bacteroides sp.]|nr:FKBP-type peptidyl-prolyl cis-trans isomerase [Bacteroides sp.]